MSIWKWMLLFILGLVLTFIYYAAGQTIDEYFIRTTVGKCVYYVLAAGLMAVLYALFVKWFEAHKAKDLPLARLIPELGKGLGFGVLMFSAVVLTMMVFGLCRFSSFGTDQPQAIILSFFNFIFVAFGEEIIFRGVFFRWLDEKWGLAVALLISSLAFGFVHIFQPGASWWSSLAISVEAGLLLGAAYKYSGNLWLPIGFHIAWNFTQGNIFGFAVSGLQQDASLLSPSVSGPDILTGGAFGPEASIFSFVLGLAISIYFILNVIRRER